MQLHWTIEEIPGARHWINRADPKRTYEASGLDHLGTTSRSSGVESNRPGTVSSREKKETDWIIRGRELNEKEGRHEDIR